MPRRRSWQHLYEQLRSDVQELKTDLEDLAARSKAPYKDAYFDAADMTKFVLEKNQ